MSKSKQTQTEWDWLRTMADEEIDYSDIPPLTSEFFARAKLILPEVVQLDPEVLDQHSESQQRKIDP